MHTVKPIDKNIIVESAKKTGAVVTAEEHNVIGGLGSAVCEVLAEEWPVPALRVGVEDSYGRSGKVPPLLEIYGLTSANIVEKAKKAISLKK
jgi:transketolase